MTARQVAEYIDAFDKACVRQFKEQASLLSGQALQNASAIGALFHKHNKFIPLAKLYPELFGRKASVRSLTPEAAQREMQRVWHEFLGV